MKPQKAYIIRIDTELSKEYAAVAAKSCDDIGLKWEYFEGYNCRSSQQEMKMWQNFGQTAGIPIKSYKKMHPPAAGCTASHAHLWKQMADRNECAIILEHDAVMYYPVDMDMPEDRIVALGYKYPNIENYNHRRAGPPKRLVEVDNNPGSHAYALHPKMAQTLVDEMINLGINEAIDNRHFMQGRERFTKTRMQITDPIAGIGWLRGSTIWGQSAMHNNVAQMLDSFKDNFEGKLRPIDKEPNKPKPDVWITR